MTAVLDSSALLAYLQGEAGTEVVRDAVPAGLAMSSVNWAETLSKLQDLDREFETLATQILADTGLQVISLEEGDAREIARLRATTRRLGLSLGDRACLALGQRMGLPVLTTDRTWQKVKTGVTVRVIR